MTGADGQRWAYLGESDLGKAMFRLDSPLPASNGNGRGRRPTPAEVFGDAVAQAPPAPLPGGPIRLARLPEGAALPDLNRERATYVYGPKQQTRRAPDGKGDKAIRPYHPKGGLWVCGAGPDPWPLYQQEQAVRTASGTGSMWLLELEGERCVAIAMAAGLAAISQPGHNHTPAAIADRYAVLAAAGKGVVYVADNDEEGERKATVCAAAAAAVGLPFLRLSASEVWPDIRQKGSIDDAPGTPADQVQALEEAANRAAAAAARMATAAEESPDPAQVAQQELREAVADGIGSADMEALLASLAQRTKLNPYNLRQMAEALQAEGQGAERIAAEAERLKKRIDQQQAGQALTLDYLLPAPIAQALELRTRYLPADAPAVACLFLSSVASLQKIGSRITGNPASGFTVPLNLWTAIIAASGQKKSPLLRRVVLDPTAEIRQTMAEGNRRDLQDWTQQCREASKGQKPDAPQPLRLHVGDVTGEALAAQLVTLAERRRGLLVLRDELSALFAGLNQYKGGGGNDGQFLLELFDGEGHTSLRINGTREFSDSLVSIAGCMQPAVLAQLVNTSTSDADGRYARFLFAPLTQQPKRLPCLTPEEQEDIDRAVTYLQEIAEAIHRDPARHLHLAPDAMELFADYEHRQSLAAGSATIPAQGAVLGKAAGKVLRVAGLLYRIDAAAGTADGLEVGPDALLRAIDLVEHLNGWVLGLHADLTAGGEPTGLMRKIHDTATGMGEPLQWRKFRDRLTAGQKKTWDRPGFNAAAQALEDLKVGRVEPGPNGTVAYLAIKALP